MAEVGPKSELTEELQAKIKKNILDGFNLRNTATNIFNELEQFKETAGEEREKELANFIQKLYNWNYLNYLNISDKIENWKRDYKLKLANENIVKILSLPTEDKDFVKVVSDMSKFVAETLDKTNYSKRSELTGKDGEALIPNQEDKAKSQEAINILLNEKQ